ncbi:hypothetical protein P43SY_005410 [Pythium insidiosum]|uniref:AAA+ ATPase domain-containing protein n=1 Tax=Pythium insidiosum TaxID=114742 RepID=A0AAD5LBY3_PYTIN|nr:hypothetical protein P43SY_005410 [Pythium insidiosum]
MVKRRRTSQDAEDSAAALASPLRGAKARPATAAAASTPAANGAAPASGLLLPSGLMDDSAGPVWTLEQLQREHAALLAALEGPYSFIRAMLSEFWDELRRAPSSPAALVVPSDAAWFWFVEMRFLVIFLYEMAFMEFSMSVTKPDSITLAAADAPQSQKQTLAHRDDMQQRVAFLDRLRRFLTELGRARLQATTAAGGRAPRVFRLAARYQLSARETELFQLLVVLQGCQSNAVRCQMIEEDALRKMMSCQRLAGISEIDVAEFYDDQREHVKEGTLQVDEENYCTVLNLSNICVRVLLGRELSSNQVLKLSQTALEELLKAEGVTLGDVLDPKDLDGEKTSSRRRRRRRQRAKQQQQQQEQEQQRSAAEDDEENDDDDDASSVDGEHLEDDGGEDDDGGEQGKPSAAAQSAYAFIGGFKNDKVAPKEPASRRSSGAAASLGDGASELTPYDPENQLEYLEDRFQVVAYAIRASGARVKDQMKEAGTKQPWEPTLPATAGRRELKAKLRVHERRTAHRLQLTRAAGHALPRLEQLARQFELNAFEQNVIVMLIGKTISPVIKNLLDGVDTSPVQRMDESVIINQLLSVFCDTFQEQVAHRVYFYKSARLLARGLVKLHRGRWHATAGDLVDQRVELDRRVLDWVVGLDTEINELVEGSDLYAPKVRLEQVVLPEDHKATILRTVESYEAFRAFRKTSGLADTLTYGTGLVLLLCGASGTGKTMTVNAVAHHLGKRVLLVDFPSLQGKRQHHDGGEVDADLRGLFREAEMSNAVLFFDECETIFRQRDVGGDRLLNALLTEMERYEGLVFLATNRPFDLDEAMHRRITAVFEFKAPDHLQRREIWRVLMHDALPVADDVDWDAIALKYELSGGFIKNAILSALLHALARDPARPVLTHADLVAGCALQMRGSLHMKTFDHRVVPTAGLDALIADDGVKRQLQQVVQFEKARSVIYGQWGFTFGDHAKQKGVSVLLCGPPGVGKVAAAKAIGFEVGKPLKLVNVAQLQAESLAESRKALRAVVDDARLMDAVLVLDGFEAFGAHLVDVGGGGVAALEAMESPRLRLELLRLLDWLDAFPGIAILVASVPATALSSLATSELARKLKFVVEVRPPNARLREQLWRACFPPAAPLADGVDLKRLAERFELSHTAISDAVFRAAASAALRDEQQRRITMKDLMDAAEVERRKARSSGAMDSLFM